MERNYRKADPAPLNSIATQFVLRLFRDAERKMRQLLLISKSYWLTFPFPGTVYNFQGCEGS